MFVQVGEDLKVDDAAKTLRLVKVGQQTLYFSDRPVRIAGHLKMSEYLQEWTSKAGKDNFGADPPNAVALRLRAGPARQHARGRRDHATRGSTAPISSTTTRSSRASSRFGGGQTALFIDWIGAGGGVGAGFHGVGVGGRGVGVR